MKPYEAWLVKAESDLKSAIKLMEGNIPIPDTAIYHTQQCAEKALKAYLSYKQQPIQKTHDIERLTELCSGIDKGFNGLLDNAKDLMPYDTAFRYPDIFLEPDIEDVMDAIKKAKRILDYVKDMIEM